jgi:CBS domain-containing protein
MQGEVAFPHARVQGERSLAVAIGLSPQGVRAGLAEEGLLQVVVLFVVPQGFSHLYLRALASLARLLQQPGSVARLVRCSSAGEVVRTLEMLEDEVYPVLKVGSVADKPEVVLLPEMLVEEALARLLPEARERAPVVSSDGTFLGEFSCASLMERIWRSRSERGEVSHTAIVKNVRQLRVAQILKRPFTLASESTLAQALRVMREKSLERCYVISAGKLEGIISLTSILAELLGI